MRAIYPDGFLPLIATKISDFSGVAGVRGERAGVRWDLSANYGRNLFHFDVRNSANVTLGAASPTEFYAGTLIFDQFTANLDLAKAFESALPGPLNVAVGGEFRRDGYQIEEGEADSWRDGGVRILDGPNAGAQGAPGAQVFPGFRPTDATDVSRNNVAGYVDLEALVDPAGCSSASPAGWSTTTTSAPPPTPRSAPGSSRRAGVAFRGAFATGFRAPSLGQSFFSATSTNFIAGVPFENRTFPVSDRRGAGARRRRRSRPRSRRTTASASRSTRCAGSRSPPTTIRSSSTTGSSSPATSPATPCGHFLEDRGFPGVAGARFFTNAIDTRTLGVDVVVNYGVPIGASTTLRMTGGYNHNVNRVLRVAPTPPELSAFQETLFDRVERARIEVGSPENSPSAGC